MFCNGICCFCSSPCVRKTKVISIIDAKNVVEQRDDIAYEQSTEVSVIEKPVEYELKKNIFGKLIPRRIT